MGKNMKLMCGCDKDSCLLILHPAAPLQVQPSFYISLWTWPSLQTVQNPLAAPRLPAPGLNYSCQEHYQTHQTLHTHLISVGSLPPTPSSAHVSRDPASAAHNMSRLHDTISEHRITESFKGPHTRAVATCPEMAPRLKASHLNTSLNVWAPCENKFKCSESHCTQAVSFLLQRARAMPT